MKTTCIEIHKQRCHFLQMCQQQFPLPGLIPGLWQPDEKVGCKLCAPPTSLWQILTCSIPSAPHSSRSPEGEGGAGWQPWDAGDANLHITRRKGFPKAVDAEAAVLHARQQTVPTPVSTAGPLCAWNRAERSGRHGLSPLGASDLWMDPTMIKHRAQFQQPHTGGATSPSSGCFDRSGSPVQNRSLLFASAWPSGRKVTCLLKKSIREDSARGKIPA